MKLMMMFILLIGARPAKACRFTRKLTDDLKKSSAVVIVGEAIEYNLMNKNRSKIKFKTLKTIRGKKEEVWEVIWEGHLFRLPDNLSEFISTFGKKTEVGLNFKDKKPFITNKVCSESYLLKQL